MALVAKAREGVDIPRDLPAELIQSAMELADVGSKPKKMSAPPPSKSKP
jgi:hypothetical protein